MLSSKFALGERHILSPQLGFVSERVELQFTGPEKSFRPSGTSAKQSPDASAEFGRAKRLDKVVVRTAIETFDAFVNRVPSGDHQNWYGVAGTANIGQQNETVLARDPKVEHEQIIRFVTQRPLASPAVSDPIDGVSFAPQPFTDTRAYEWITFYQ